jgi:RNA polymerase sigma-70 factor (ECF subfamily)
MIVKRNAQAVSSAYEVCAEEEIFIARLKVGDGEAVSRFVEENRQRIFSFIFSILMNKEDAEDVTQETLIKAIENISSFNGDSSLTTWVLRIGRNAALDLKRKKSRTEALLLEGEVLEQGSSRGSGRVQGSAGASSFSGEAGRIATPLTGVGGIEFGSGVECPGELLQIKEKLSLLNTILADISREHREVLILREVDGLSYDEIAEVVGVSRGTVMSRLFYARKRIQQCLESVEEVAEVESEGSRHESLRCSQVASQVAGVEPFRKTLDTNRSDSRDGKAARRSGGRFSFGRFAGLGFF